MPMQFSSGGSGPRTPSVAPSGTPRTVRSGQYLITYAPNGAILSRVYSPIMNPPSTIRNASSANSGSSRTPTLTIGSRSAPASMSPNEQKRAQVSANTGYQSGGSSMARPDSYADPGYGGGDSIGSGSATGAGGSSSIGGSSGDVQNANSGITYSGPFKGIDDKEADYMVANPLAIAAKVFGLTPQQMANSPTLAGLLSPVLEAAQNPYIGAVMNPGVGAVPDQNDELNFAANLLRQYTTPGGSFLSPTAGLRGLQSAMGNPGSILNKLLSTTTGNGAASAAAQLDLFNKIMAPFLSMGTGAWGSDLFDAAAYDAYNNYTLGQAASPGIPSQDFLSYLMGQMGYPASLK